MTGFIAFAAAGRHAEEVCRGLNLALFVAAALIAVQGLFVP